MRLIDADALQKEYQKEHGKRLLLIDVAPTIDAVEVVRCKDCKWWEVIDEDNGVLYGQCRHPFYMISDTVFTGESWYCANGERKKDNE